jgi:hypothetical protein
LSRRRSSHSTSEALTDAGIHVDSWTPTGAPARASLRFEAECTLLSGALGFSSGTLSIDSNADGRESVSIDSIVTLARSGSTSTITRCSIDVIVSHELQGRIDPAFRNGTAVGIVSHKVNLDYIPR